MSKLRPCVLCLVWLSACTFERPDTSGGTGFATGGGGSLSSSSTTTDGADATSTGDSGDSSGPGGLDVPGCDPLLDPAQECGPDLTCDLDTLSCVPRQGVGVVDDPCVDDGECSPGLICIDERCRSLCDVEGAASCGVGEVCVDAFDPIPGLCLDDCDIIMQTCSHPDDGCNRATGPGPSLVAACTANPGMGTSDEACNVDGDCFPGHLCTDEAQHANSCIGGAPACCAPICDSFNPFCVGFEVCTDLGITDQPGAGYCGI